MESGSDPLYSVNQHTDTYRLNAFHSHPTVSLSSSLSLSVYCPLTFVLLATPAICGLCCCYRSLCGFPPFYHESTAALYKQIKKVRRSNRTLISV